MTNFNFSNFDFFGTSPKNTSKKRAGKQRRGRQCRIEELEGREMLSVSPWAITNDFDQNDTILVNTSNVQAHELAPLGLAAPDITGQVGNKGDEIVLRFSRVSGESYTLQWQNSGESWEDVWTSQAGSLAVLTGVTFDDNANSGRLVIKGLATEQQYVFQVVASDGTNEAISEPITKEGFFANTDVWGKTKVAANKAAASMNTVTVTITVSASEYQKMTGAGKTAIYKIDGGADPAGVFVEVNADNFKVSGQNYVANAQIDLGGPAKNKTLTVTSLNAKDNFTKTVKVSTAQKYTDVKGVKNAAMTLSTITLQFNAFSLMPETDKVALTLTAGKSGKPGYDEWILEFAKVGDDWTVVKDAGLSINKDKLFKFHDIGSQDPGKAPGKLLKAPLYTLEIGGLAASTKYAVSFQSSRGTTPPAKAVKTSVSTVKYTAVKGLKASVVGESVNLSWTPHPNTGTTAATIGYEVWMLTKKGKDMKEVLLTTVYGGSKNSASVAFRTLELNALDGSIKEGKDWKPTLLVRAVGEGPDGTITQSLFAKKAVKVGQSIEFNEPDSPTRFRATSTDTGIVLEWDESFIATVGFYEGGYEIRYREANEAETVETWATPIVIASGYTKEHTLSDFTSGKTYLFEIRAVYAPPTGTYKSLWAGVFAKAKAPVVPEGPVYDNAGEITYNASSTANANTEIGTVEFANDGAAAGLEYSAAYYDGSKWVVIPGSTQTTTEGQESLTVTANLSGLAGKSVVVFKGATQTELDALALSSDAGVTVGASVTIPTLTGTVRVGRDTNPITATFDSAIVADDSGIGDWFIWTRAISSANWVKQGAAFSVSEGDDTVKEFTINATGLAAGAQYMIAMGESTPDDDYRTAIGDVLENFHAAILTPPSLAGTVLSNSASNTVTLTFASTPEGEALGDWYVWTRPGTSGAWTRITAGAVSKQEVKSGTLTYEFTVSTLGLGAGTYYMVGKGVEGGGGAIVADAAYQTGTGRMLENTVLGDVFPLNAVAGDNPQTEVKLTWTPVFDATKGYKTQISADRVNWVDLSTTALSGQTVTVLNGAQLSSVIDTQETELVTVTGLTAGAVYYFQIKAAATEVGSESIAWTVASITTEPSAGQRLIQGFGIREKKAGEGAVGQGAGAGVLALTQTAVVLTWALPAGVPEAPAVELVTATGLGGGTMPAAADFANNLGDTFSDYFVIEYRIAGSDTWEELTLGSSVPSQGGTPRIQTDFDERATYINGINLQGARTTQANIIGLTPNRSYEFRMMAKAVGSNEATDWSAIVSVTTGFAFGMYQNAAGATDREIAKPKNIKTESSTGSSITLSWDAPVGTNNPAQFYVIRYREAGTDTWYTWGPNTTTTAPDNLANNVAALRFFHEIKGTVATITGLMEGQEYEFQIKALAKFGGGGDTYHYMQGIGDGGAVQPDWTDTYTATAESTPPPVIPNAPNPVTAVTFGSVSESERVASFTWTAPVVDASHDAHDGYNVAYRFNGGVWLATDSASIVGTTVNINLAGLESFTEYGIEVMVQARNAGGVSDWVGLNGFILTAEMEGIDDGSDIM